MITKQQAKKEIENYFEDFDFNKSLIDEDVIIGFVEMCNDDYENWIKDMLNSFFNDNGQKFENKKFFFEK
jgi:hypothetical protein